MPSLEAIRKDLVKQKPVHVTREGKILLEREVRWTPEGTLVEKGKHAYPVTRLRPTRWF